MEFDGGEYTLSVRELIQSLWRRAWIVAFSALLFLGGATGFSLLQTPQYESSIEILVRQESAISQSPNEALGLQQITATIAQTVESRRVAEAVIQDLNLRISPEDFLENMTVEQVPETQVVNVTYTHPVPEEARTIADAIGEQFSAQIAEESSGSGSITATVWDNAAVAEEPSSPNIARNAVLAVVVGLGAGLGVALLLEFFDDSWHSPEEAERVSGVPTLAVIPRFGDVDKSSYRAAKRRDRKSKPEARDDGRASGPLASGGPKRMLLKGDGGDTTRVLDVEKTFDGGQRPGPERGRTI